MSASLPLDLARNAARRLRSSVKLYEACVELVRHGDVNSALPALNHLAQDSPYARDARHLLSVCKQLRRSRLLDETVSVTDILEDLRQVDRDALDLTEPGSVLVRRVDDAEATLAIFVTRGGIIWITMALLHHYLRDYPVNLLYVRDDHSRFHMGGLNGLGADFARSAEGLADLVGALDAPRLYCIGGSAGGYAALRFALALGAEAVMGFSAPTTIDPARVSPGRMDSLGPLLATAPHHAIDLLPLYLATPVRPRTILCFGADNTADRHQAERFDAMPEVRLLPIESYANHDTLAYFAINRRFDHMFALLRGEP